MKNEIENKDSMDELVFENRNKDYGAYVLRKEYTENVQQAFNMVCIAGSAIMIVMALMSDEPVIKVPFKAELPVIRFDKEPEVLVRPAQPAAPAPRGVRQNLTPKVTTAIPAAEEVTGEEQPVGFEEGQGDANAVGTMETQTAGLGDVPVEAVPEPPKLVDWAEVMPKYKGGNEAMMKFMQKKTKYPAIARRVNTQGTVFVSFIIDTGGRVIDAKVVKGISKECDEEAVRVITAMPDWDAGRMGDRPVMVRMVLPIKFVLNTL